MKNVRHMKLILNLEQDSYVCCFDEEHILFGYDLSKTIREYNKLIAKSVKYRSVDIRIHQDMDEIVEDIFRRVLYRTIRSTWKKYKDSHTEFEDEIYSDFL